MKQFNNLTIPIIFFGSSSNVIPILEVLRKNFDLKLVVTTEKNPTDDIPAYCIKNKISYLSVQQFNNLTIQQLEKLNATVGILADFGIIIPNDVLNLFPKGIINIHPSLLPRYRGPAPVQTTILNGDKVTGVTIMKLDEEIDHGSILGQEKETILDADTSETLYKRLFEKGANLLLKVLPKYLDSSLNSIPQNHKQATFTEHLTRQNGYIDLSSLEIRNCLPTEEGKLEIARKIRAYYPWPGVWTKMRINNKELRIKFLPDKKIQIEGKKPMSYKDFLNGYPELKQQLAKLLE